MSLSTRVIISLFAGLILGIVIAAADIAVLERLAIFVEPVGTLWLNALRMTVIPLVVALLITGAASASETASTGKLAARSLLLFILFMAAAATLSALLVPTALAWFPVDAEAANALRAGATQAAQVPDMPRLREFVTGIIPTNPFAAASDGEMLPLVVFALAFGFAASRITVTRREPLLGFFQAVVDTMFVLVHWILVVAPIGVFVLALGVGLRGGVDAAGALAHYLVLLCSLATLVTLLLYPVAVFAAGIGLRRFARAVAPAQVVAFSTQSSLASLPAMIERAQDFLRLPTRITSIVLPLAVSLFRVTSPPMNLAIVIFVAHVYGVPLGATQIVAGVAVAVLTNFAVVGLPGQITFFTTTVPISMAMGVPVELLPVLMAVEVIPDIIRTVGNVTADMTVTAIMARSGGAPGGEATENAAPARGDG